jgi:methylglutaconyl-CoA hydratase
MEQTLLTCSPHAITDAKQLLRTVAGKEINANLIADTIQRIANSRASEQGREGVQAFLNKRKPSWLSDNS